MIQNSLFCLIFSIGIDIISPCDTFVTPMIHKSCAVVKEDHIMKKSTIIRLAILAVFILAGILFGNWLGPVLLNSL